MREEWIRTGLLLGEEAVEGFGKARIAVFGIGGVGGFAAEALARSGIGALDIIDNDTVALSNINRQIIATHKTVGQWKVDAMKDRLLAINPEICVRTYKSFFLPENAAEFDFHKYDYVVDAIDTVTAKLELAVRTYEAGTPLISSMGAGNKLDPTRFEVADIYQTSVCPLAKVMRKELKARGIPALKVVYSKEPALCPVQPEGTVQADVQSKRRTTPGSVAFVPSVAGLIMAGEVLKDLSDGFACRILQRNGDRGKK